MHNFNSFLGEQVNCKGMVWRLYLCKWVHLYMMHFLYFYNILVVVIGMCVIESEVCCIYSKQCSLVLHGTLFLMYEMLLCGFLHIGVKCQSSCFLSGLLFWDAKDYFSLLESETSSLEGKNGHITWLDFLRSLSDNTLCSAW